jgi:hypothetical protein
MLDRMVRIEPYPFSPGRLLKETIESFLLNPQSIDCMPES